MFEAEEAPVKNTGWEWDRIGNSTKASKPGNANGLSILNGNHDRGKDTEENIGKKGRQKADCARGQDRSNVRVRLAFHSWQHHNR